MLWLIVRTRSQRVANAGDWYSGCALFAYVAAFSFAYVSLPVASGALLLFGAVQATMIGYGLWNGEKLGSRQIGGLAIALLGLVGLLLPGLSAPPLNGSLLMAVAGIAWGVYSLRAKGAIDPVRVTAGNFARAAPLILALNLIMLPTVALDRAGVLYALVSGGLASGVGYVFWYAALRQLSATNAATVQLSVPVLAAIGGIAFLGEPVSWHLFITSAAILGGIALVTIGPRRIR